MKVTELPQWETAFRPSFGTPPSRVVPYELAGVGDVVEAKGSVDSETDPNGAASS